MKDPQGKYCFNARILIILEFGRYPVLHQPDADSITGGWVGTRFI